MPSATASVPLYEQSRQLRQAVRDLLLPIAPKNEGAVLAAVGTSLGANFQSPDDFAEWIRTENGLWLSEHRRTDRFTRLVTAAIRVGASSHAEVLASRYFSMHDALQTRKFGLSFMQATLFLSHAGTAASLAEERLSSSQIAATLTARDPWLAGRWELVECVLAKLKLEPALDSDRVNEVADADSSNQLDFFADADAATAAYLVGQRARDLMFVGDLENLLFSLSPPDGEPFVPYLQILHFQCMALEFYDADPTAAYEFHPRGALAKAFAARYPGDRGSAFLNNLKSVRHLNTEWALSRDERTRAQARVVVDILEGLRSLGFSARRDLSAWLRAWLERQIIRLQARVELLPEAFTLAQVNSVFNSVASGNTQTWGVVEQRVVEAIAMRRLQLPEWIPRGIGDSVNASNTSSRKLGDCDFQDPARSVAVAFEAHAGALTESYLEEHARTLKSVMAARRSEWKGTSDPDAWSARVVFVAHEFKATPTESRVIEGTPVTFEFEDFPAFVASLPLTETVAESISREINHLLNRTSTPQQLRQKYATLARAALVAPTAP